MTGHLLGATGGLEAIFSALSIRDSKVINDQSLI
jgi:3-oxoacyl-[acyl-carrier-protein] synthase II